MFTYYRDTANEPAAGGGYRETSITDEAHYSRDSGFVAIAASDRRAAANSIPEVDSTPALVRSLFEAAIREDLLYQLARSIRKLNFEARKDTQTIMTHLLRYKPTDAPGDPPAINYIVHQRPEVIIELCRGFENSQSALSCASILKEAIKFDVIAALILYDESSDSEPAVRLKDLRAEQPQSGNGIFWKFFDWIDKGSFEVSADAFTIFRVGLHPQQGSGTCVTHPRVGPPYPP